jgi:hypothetical protein
MPKKMAKRDGFFSKFEVSFEKRGYINKKVIVTLTFNGLLKEMYYNTQMENFNQVSMLFTKDGVPFNYNILMIKEDEHIFNFLKLLCVARFSNSECQQVKEENARKTSTDNSDRINISLESDEISEEGVELEYVELK